MLGELVNMTSVKDSLANISQNFKYTYLNVSKEMYKQITVAIMR